MRRLNQRALLFSRIIIVHQALLLWQSIHLAKGLERKERTGQNHGIVLILYIQLILVLVGEIRHIVKIVGVTGNQHMSKYKVFQPLELRTVNYQIHPIVIPSVDTVMGVNRRMNSILSCVGGEGPPPAHLLHAALLILLVPHWDLALPIQICQIALLFAKVRYVTIPSAVNAVSQIQTAAQMFVI